MNGVSGTQLTTHLHAARHKWDEVITALKIYGYVQEQFKEHHIVMLKGVNGTAVLHRTIESQPRLDDEEIIRLTISAGQPDELFHNYSAEKIVEQVIAVLGDPAA